MLFVLSSKFKRFYQLGQFQSIPKLTRIFFSYLKLIVNIDGVVTSLHFLKTN